MKVTSMKVTSAKVTDNKIGGGSSSINDTWVDRKIGAGSSDSPQHTDGL